jgi:hypothetical protein
MSRRFLLRGQSLLDQIEPFQIGLRVQHRALDQELGGDALAVGSQQRVEIAQRLQVLAPLPLDQGLRLRQPGRRNHDELHEELVLEPRPRHRRLDPARQRDPSVLGELVHALAPVVARDAMADDETVALEPRQRRVDLPGVQRRQQLPELLLERLPELIAVAALAGEKGKEYLSHR